MKELTLELALKAIEAAEKWAKRTPKIPISVAVVNKAGAVIAAHRQDGSLPMSIETAIKKAWTAIYFQGPTLMPARFIDPRSVTSPMIGNHALGVGAVAPGRAALIAGAMPIFSDDNDIIGAIGASGCPDAVGDVSDTAVCQAGWTALFL